VAYLFDRKGVLSVDAGTTDEDTLMAIALDAGAEDMKLSGSTFDIICDPAVFQQVKDALAKSNITPSMAEVTQIPKVPTEVSVEEAKKVMRLMEALDDHDDTQNVYSSVHLDEQMVAEMANE
jgi:transcriptional/translational regulatory protein YebC/TACO1